MNIACSALIKACVGSRKVVWCNLPTALLNEAKPSKCEIIIRFSKDPLKCLALWCDNAMIDKV